MRYKRMPRVRQHDTTDCGPACLASIAKHHGTIIPLARIRQLAHTDRGGTTIMGLTRAASQMGFIARGVTGDQHNLPHAPLPAIAHLALENGSRHFVVLERVGERTVDLMDPKDGQGRTVPREEFQRQWTGILVLFTHTGAPLEQHVVDSRGMRLWRLVVSHRSALVQALAGALVYTLLGLAISLYVQQLVDTVLADGRMGALRVMTLAMVGITIAQTIVGALRATLMLDVGQRVDATLILGYYNHVLRLPQEFFDRMRVGELTSRVTDAVKIRAFVGEVLVDAVANVLIIVAAAAMMLTYDWRLAAWTFLLIPVYAVLYMVGSHLNRGQQRGLLQRGAVLESQLVESLTTIGTIKRFGMERDAADRTEARFVDLFRLAGDAARTSIWLGNSSALLSRLGVIGLLWIGANRALAQGLSAGELMSCYALFGFLNGPLLSLVGFSRSLEEVRAACDRLFEVMELAPEPPGGPITLPRPAVLDVRFENVTFGYGDRGDALSDVSFTCPAGRVTALVGESGSGKSTIASLVERVYTVDQGRVLLGGHDVAHVERESLRGAVGIVPQTIDLFTGTLLENAALGSTSPDMERLYHLFADVGLHDVMARLRLGWRTPVGERGVLLSGGERQRLAIVRALYRQPAVLVLDEATSALDWKNEERIVSVMHRLAREGMTVIVIAHRLTTIQGADHIVVLKKGRVVQQGSHTSLIAEDGAYARMWEHQGPPPRHVLAAV